MKKIFILLSCCVGVSVFAETIQNVEYSLPKSAEHWVVGNKLESSMGTTVIYIPEGVERQNAQEFFGVNANPLITDVDDSSEIQSGLSQMLPGMHVDLHMLEKNGDSAIYEWSAQENGGEKVHGWGRVFADKGGTIILGYQTLKIADVPNARSIWLPTLKDAKKLPANN